MTFQSKVALVTGAGGGIGLAAAQAFAREGAFVVLVDVNEKLVMTKAAEINKAGGTALAMASDVSLEQSVQAMVEKTVEHFGGLDYAFNNAGIHVDMAETADFPTEDWDRLMNVNLRGIFLCMKYELQYMRKKGDGAIVNCSSQSGLRGLPGITAYTASKHGVIGLTKAAALEYAGKNIRINAICPGMTNTPMVQGLLENEPGRLEHITAAIPLGRMASSDEVADTVIWLCSPKSSFVVGQAIAVDGGFTAK